MHNLEVTETIVACATPPGRGGIGIVRLSGPAAVEITQKIIGFIPKPRYAEFCSFSDQKQNTIDEGIVLRFVAPFSFTGEDVIEFQGHGGPVIIDSLISTVLSYGARVARPGEFSERAFLNDKIDLAQAEAIADLINSSSQQGARLAVKSLQGFFSKKIDDFVEKLTNLRIYVEAAIDFPEEEIDFIGDGVVAESLDKLISGLELIKSQASQGVILQEGISVVLAGAPNVGKSTLLNSLAKKDLAIVTNIAGTTRDVRAEKILIDGIPLNIIDTAGIRDSDDLIEKEGISRALREIKKADIVLLITDVCDEQGIEQEKVKLLSKLDTNAKLIVVINKIDEHNLNPKKSGELIYLSAKQHLGLTC